MTNSLDLAEWKPENFLWNELNELIGIEKASYAIRQAVDLQRMAGKEDTLPVLFLETCGIALTTLAFLKSQTGLSISGKNNVLILSSRKKTFQVLHKS